MNASFQYDRDNYKSQSSYVFTLNGRAVSWKSSKQETVWCFAIGTKFNRKYTSSD